MIVQAAVSFLKMNAAGKSFDFDTEARISLFRTFFIAAAIVCFVIAADINRKDLLPLHDYGPNLWRSRRVAEFME